MQLGAAAFVPHTGVWDCMSQAGRAEIREAVLGL